MNQVKIFDFKHIESLINKREGETKFGEKVLFLKDPEDLEKSKAKFVLFGIPEDIGIRANFGKPGAAKAWKTGLKALLNVQANQFTQPEKLMLLGEVDCNALMDKASYLDENDPNYLIKLGELVEQLDVVVSGLVEQIIAAGKIPIILGGGHNNAYGNIKGASQALNKPINVLNIDAHTDLRKTDHRHSGNGFSYAREKKYIGKYRIFGLHQNYTPQYIFDKINASTTDQFRLFEHLNLKSSVDITKAFREELDVAANEDFGLELDCDAIKGFPSSAKTPSGFPINMIRNFIRTAAEEENIRYLHICEAAPDKDSEVEVGKALSYFITDFIH